ncbi:hypothetical protein GLOIN_2v1652323 [Rhizophagus irregularis DAOM 181602=DAOM 197198]|nr:hypothetical protein GLOIN_2v1652323 [Rhizophagus irregularis DAOM 181602=DAOM 197198]
MTIAKSRYVKRISLHVSTFNTRLQNITQVMMFTKLVCKKLPEELQGKGIIDNIANKRSFFLQIVGMPKFIEETEHVQQHHNNFCEISSKFTPATTSIEILQNDMAQRYAVIQRPDFDQQSVSNGSETNSRGSSTNSSSGSSGSSQRFANIISVIREQFSDIFDRIKGANNYSLCCYIG